MRSIRFLAEVITKLPKNVPCFRQDNGLRKKAWKGDAWPRFFHLLLGLQLFVTFIFWLESSQNFPSCRSLVIHSSLQHGWILGESCQFRTAFVFQKLETLKILKIPIMFYPLEKPKNVISSWTTSGNHISTYPYLYIKGVKFRSFWPFSRNFVPAKSFKIAKLNTCRVWDYLSPNIWSKYDIYNRISHIST